MEREPPPDQRMKWKSALSGFNEADLAYMIEKLVYAIDKVEKQRAQTASLVRDDYLFAAINFCVMCGMMMERMFPELEAESRCPRTVAWRARVTARPAVARFPAGEDRTAPALRTSTGHAR